MQFRVGFGLARRIFGGDPTPPSIIKKPGSPVTPTAGKLKDPGYNKLYLLFHFGFGDGVDNAGQLAGEFDFFLEIFIGSDN
jgi:hypothetical protein